MTILVLTRHVPRPMKNGIRNVPIWILTLLCASCDEPASIPARAAPPDLGGLRGVYEGTFPCANCPGIDIRLWLREDGVFFLRQEYLAAEPAPADRVHALGRWRWDADESRLVLDGRGPQRKFAYSGNDRITLQTLSPVDHVLIRQRDDSPFLDSIMLDGEITTASEPTIFRECVTGLSLPIRRDAGDRDLRRQHRRLSSPDVAALVVIQGRLDYADPSAPEAAVLVVEQTVSIRPKAQCSSPI
jgi:copper homeostasis protein (lipoprotein)